MTKKKVELTGTLRADWIESWYINLTIGEPDDDCPDDLCIAIKKALGWESEYSKDAESANVKITIEVLDEPNS